MLSTYTSNLGRAAETSQYWEDVRERLAEIETAHPGKDFVYITSIERRRDRIVGGRVTDATLRVAAIRLAEETHRLSTPEEIEAELARRAAEAARCKAFEDRRANKETAEELTVKAQMNAQVVAAAVQAVLASQKQQEQQSERKKVNPNG